MTADPTLGIGAYLTGLLWLLVVGAALAGSAAVIAPRVGPPPIRWVAGAVVALLQVTVTAQGLGAVGLLRTWPWAAALVAGTIAIRRALPAWEPSNDVVPAAPPLSRTPRVERLAALAAVAVVAAQWTSHSVDALQRGMTHADTLWYHGPFSARFLQMGSLGDLDNVGYLQARYYPLGSELLHTVVALPFHRDLLSPVVNLGFAALALGAAWVIGQRWGAGAIALLGAAAGLSLPTLAGTQPGQASNDIVVVALFLAAAAIGLHAAGRTLPLAVAGASLGLAVGTKVTIVAMAAVLLLGLGWPLVRQGTWRAVAALGLGALAPALAWPVRNLVVAGNPLPFWEISVGPIRLAAVAPTTGNPSVVSDLLAGSTWSYQDGLRNGFGPLWVLLILVAVIGPWAVLLRGPAGLRALASAALVGAAVYTVTPVTGGSSFQFNLRYLAPAIVTGLVLAAVGSAHRAATRTATGMVLAVGILTAVAAEHHERVAAWPGTPLQTGLVAAGLCVGAGAVVFLHRTPAHHSMGAAFVVVTLAVGGWFVQQHHLENRYVAAELHDDVLNAKFRTVTGSHVDVLGTPESYPFFGADLSNEVRDWSREMSLDVPQPAEPCRFWRGALDERGWLVVSTYGYAMVHFDAAARSAILHEDAATELRYEDRERTVYWLDAALDPTDCG